MRLRTASRLYGIATDLAAANLNQSQLLLAISMELVCVQRPFQAPSPCLILAGVAHAAGYMLEVQGETAGVGARVKKRLRDPWRRLGYVEVLHASIAEVACVRKLLTV
jgi:hypothetical protein